MKKSLKLVLFLAIVAAISGLSIGIVNQYTEPVIKQNAVNAEKKNLELIYPESEFSALDYEDKDGVIIGAYAVEGKGYVFKTTATGYNSSTPIITLIGMDNDGTITNVIALQQSETNNIGSHCFEKKNIQSLYVGKTVEEEPDMYAGATFTSTAMKTMIQKAQEAYLKVIGG